MHMLSRPKKAIALLAAFAVCLVAAPRMIQAAGTTVTKASATIRHIRWFEVIETRGQVENGKVHYYQVTLKIGFSIEDEHVHLQP